MEEADVLYGVTIRDEGVSSCSPSMSTTCTRNLKSDRKEMRMGLFDKIRARSPKTRQSFGENLNAVMSGFRHVDEDFLEELLEVLVMADVGP